jgi:ketosteroid isomerase-like protein
MKQQLDGFMGYFHENYRGWSYDNPLPADKATVKKFVSHEMATSKILVQNLQPVAIQIYGNVAFADYYYSRVIKDAEGKEKTVSGRWTDILTKQGDKWVLIGDHGGQTSKP